MLTFLLKRLTGALLVLVGVSFITFLLLGTAPGDAADILAGESASKEQMEALRQQLGLDAPLLERYGDFISAAVTRGDLGDSLFYQRPVSELLLERFNHTLTLTLIASGVALLIGFVTGALAAERANSYLDLGLMSMVALGIALPSFWLALLLMMVFSVNLGWLPVVGSGSIRHLVLPVVCLALPTSALVARLVRSSLLDVSQEDYVNTANAKGLNRFTVWQRHIVRNGMIPVITVVGLYLGHLLSGVFIIETIFALPGLGRLAVQSIFNRDFPVVVGSVLLIAVIYQLLNLGVDIAQVFLDPRIRQDVLQ